MLLFRYAVALAPNIALLLFIGTWLLKTLRHQGLPSPLITAFDDQFDSLEQLTLSLARSTPHTKNLQIHSVAFEDLSYALAGSLGEDLLQDVRSLSLDIEAFATLLQRFYVEIDVLVHLTAATGHIFGKLLQRQPPDRLFRHLCRMPRLRASVRCQAPPQVSLGLRGHFNTLSGALESLSPLAIDVVLAHERLQHRVEAVVATIVHTTDLPMGEDCDLFLALWNLFDRDGEEFLASTRNEAAFRTFCVHLVYLGHQLDQDMASVRALQDALVASSIAQAANFYPDIQPSFSATLIQRVETVLRFRAVGKQGRIHDQRTIEAR